MISPHSDSAGSAGDAAEYARKLFAGPCDFIAGAATVDALLPPSLPEIAFVGRSNVGKSSLVNALTNRKSLARVSHTPGATRQINFFRLGNACILVDLPGYGYARASKSLAAEWQQLIFAYLRGRTTLLRTILLIDARRGVMPVDREAMGLMDQAAISYLGVLTKIDEIKPAQRQAVQEECLRELSKQTAAYPEVLATSSQSGEGLDGLKQHIVELIAPLAAP